MSHGVVAESHPSALVLDEIAAGLEVGPEAAAHAGSCPVCRRILEQRQLGARELRAEVGYHRTLTKLEVDSRQAPTRRLFAVFGMGAALAIGAWLISPILLPHPSETLGIKGGPSLEVIDVQGAAVHRPLAVGSPVALKLGASGAKEALILSVDSAGHASQLWPTSGTSSAPVPGAAITVLSPAFSVNPGSLVLIALLSETPLQSATALAAFEATPASSSRVTALVGRPRLPGEQARAFAILCVEGSPCPQLR